MHRFQFGRFTLFRDRLVQLVVEYFHWVMHESIVFRINMTSTVETVLNSSEVVFEGSPAQKAIQALAVDSTGHRMVSGGVDGVVKYWEFSGMNGSDPAAFREFTPVEGHAINALSFNANGGLVLCIASDAKARVFDREGSARAVEETIKGDPYIRTPENTKGHTHMLSCGNFHPIDLHRFMTGSYDCTVRLWDLTVGRIGMDQNIPHTNCFKCTDSRGLCGGKGMFVSSASYSGDGHQIVAGCSDGSLQIFSDKLKHGKASLVARTAHEAEVTDVQFYSDDHSLVSRSVDGTVRLWDLRQLRKSEPVHVFGEGLGCSRSGSNVALFGDAILVGNDQGELIVIDRVSKSVVVRKKLPARELVRVTFHPVLNQILTTSSDGNIFMLFDPIVSRGGANLFVHKSAPKRHPDMQAGQVVNREVFSYEELLTSGKYKENKQGELRAVDTRIKVPRPMEVSANILSALEGRARPTAAPANTELEGMQQSLLAGIASSKSGLVSTAYSRTQPEPVLDFSDAHGAADSLLRKRAYCPKCGLKICTCGYMQAQPAVSNPVTGPSVSSKMPRYG